jgi:hypothetical protein
VTRREWWVVVGGTAVLGTLGLVVTLVVRPGDANLAVEAYVLFVGALGMALLVRATTRLFPPQTASRIERLGRPPRKDRRLGELVRIERELEMATESAFDTYYRLRPLLRELAEARLAKRGVELDGPGSRAAELLGPDAWELVRPDLVRPAKHHAAGVRLATVERAVTALEQLE